MSKKSEIGKYRRHDDTERAKYYELAVQIIQRDQRIMFMRDVIDMLPIGHTKFYELFPTGSAELSNLQKFLDGNKVPQRLQMRELMIKMNSPQTVMAMYRLIATPEERKLLSSAQQPEDINIAENAGGAIDIEGYQERVRETLKSVNRYSPVLDLEIAAMASAWATLNAANKAIASLDSPFMEEVSTQGKKVVQHPAFALQQKALESMSKHAKLLGIDYENAPAAATDGPLAALTKEVISYARQQQGHMTVEKENKGRRKKK